MVASLADPSSASWNVPRVVGVHSHVVIHLARGAESGDGLSAIEVLDAHLNLGDVQVRTAEAALEMQARCTKRDELPAAASSKAGGRARNVFGVMQRGDEMLVHAVARLEPSQDCSGYSAAAFFGCRSCH